MIGRILLCALMFVVAPALQADEVGSLRAQVADLRNQLQQRGDMNANWLLRQQLRELRSTVAQQEMRIRALATLVVAAGLRERTPEPSSAAGDNELALRLTDLCKRTTWGEAVPAATCKQLGIEQTPPAQRPQ